ncbi:alpha/beta fold hydrolase [Kovacikia minuta CCNUW1]|uniref:alpha/beta hydrolase n=1 Tax=Kovacikia minuta TaxID=2931930 RepID=UPI001CCDC0FF|nr:alpha/beta hydrolase [Kovacikia minuta]UBF25085.1 alpha/beta fold hydrolase [Kovacikia minuta CCNUW1]
MTLMQRLKPVLVICGLTLPVAIAPIGDAAPTTVSAPPVPQLNWQPCTDPDQKGFQCATAKVPLDYRNPRGESIQLAVIKHPATDRSRRIGSLFLNPGGPGGAGTEDLPAWFSLFPAELQQRFDIISFDPRGIGNSTAVQCFANEEEGKRFFTQLPQGFPVGDKEIRAWIRGYERLGQLCQQKSGKLLAHVSTVEVAKDMDLLRRAVGSPMLNYVGLSYGTYLGAVYANLFPNRVKAMVLDGNIDPSGAWNNGGKGDTRLSISLRIGSDVGSAKTLKAFLDLCGQASRDRCAFSAGSAQATQAKFTALLEKLRKQPVTLNGKTFTYAVFLYALSADLFVVKNFGGFKGWASAAELLQKVWEAPAATSSDPATIPLIAPDVGFFSVGCADTPNPRNPEAYRQLAAVTSARAGAIGLNAVWGDLACSTWPAVSANRYTGPWNRPAANPILVIGNTFDPSTPYEGSIAMARDLARARLLTIDGFGHTVFLNPSQCANQYITNYFIKGQLPPEGARCKQDYQPFTPI